MELPNGIKSSIDLLDAQSHIWNHIFNFINSMSLKCAIELGLPDIIHNYGKPITLSNLTQALPINKAKSPCVARLMRVLVQSKFFVKVKISEDEEGYWLTPASRLLLRDDPLSVGPYTRAILDPIFTNQWHLLSKWFQNNDPTLFETSHGKTLWEHMGHDPTMNQIFNEAMANDARLVSSVLIEHCRQVFEGLKSMVDLAGGTGTMAKLIGDSFPELKCVVLDLPHVINGLEGTNNLTFIGGDMFEYIPPADAILMKWILHGWPDEECVKILKKCKEAIPSKDKGGKVIIIDMVVVEKEEHKEIETQLLFDMHMMSFSGRQRSEKEWANLFFAAGFSSYNIIHVLGLRSLIEVLP